MANVPGPAGASLSFEGHDDYHGDNVVGKMAMVRVIMQVLEKWKIS